MSDIQKGRQNSRHFIGVYALPIAAGLTIFGLAYFISEKFNLDSTDRFFGYFIGIAVVLTLHIRNRFKWLPLPNGSYIHTEELQDEIKQDFAHFTEPTNYVVTFSYSNISKILLITCGLGMIAWSIFVFSKTSIVFPIVIIAGGVFLFYSGYKEMVDTAPKLKLAKDGLWTKELGFRPWTAIRKTEIKIDKGFYTRQTYLEIYLQNSNIDYPKQRLLLNDIRHRNEIKPMIDKLSGSVAENRE